MAEENPDILKKKIPHFSPGFFLILFSAGFTWFWLSLSFPLFSTPYSTVIYSNTGELLGGKIAGDGQWRFPPATKIPYKFRTCLLQFEDRYFFHHVGVNPVALLRALRQNFNAGRTISGGSTLTMQTIRLSKNGVPRTHYEKLKEIFQALRLELTVSKKNILLYYAAHAPFGGNVVGLEAAASRYYGKSPENLSWAEAATLAVLPNAPSLIYPGKNQEILRKKRNRLLNRLREENIIDSTTYELALLEEIPGKPEAMPADAPHLLDRQKEGSFSSTIDRQLQLYAASVLERHLEKHKANHIYNGAVLIADVHTGEVKAYLGNSSGNNPAHGNSVDIIHAKRSPGSLLKPLLYAALLDGGELLPDMLVPDYPVSFRGYSPKNFDENYDGAVPASEAIARSLNVPAVKMLASFGTARFQNLLRRGGLTTLNRPADHYGLSLILGGGEINLWELSNIYLQLAASLSSSKVPVLHVNRSDSSQHQSTALAGRHAAWFMLKAMSSAERPESGLNWQYFSSSSPVAWKTGTSYGHRDGWAIGITPDYLVGVWIGNANGEGRPDLTGLSTAAPIMLEIFRKLPSTSGFQKPGDLQTIKVCRESGFPANPDCPNPNEEEVPDVPLKSVTCSYHKMVHLNETLSNQVNADCYSKSRIRSVPMFVLPPSMEWYYRQKHPLYTPLPAFLPGCNSKGNPISVIYPANGTEIYIPLNLDETRSQTIFEAAHSIANAELYWHIDGVFLGSTRGLHRIAYLGSNGKHRLVVVDENGNSAEREFTVKSR